MDDALNNDTTFFFAPLPEFGPLQTTDATNVNSENWSVPDTFDISAAINNYEPHTNPASFFSSMSNEYRHPPAPMKIKRKRNRKTLSCECCRRRKVKCDRSLPCKNCVGRKEECIWGKGIPKHVHTDLSMLDQLDKTPAVIRIDDKGNFYHAHPDIASAAANTIHTGSRGRPRGTSFGSNASTNITVPSTASYDSGYSTDTTPMQLYQPRYPSTSQSVQYFVRPQCPPAQEHHPVELKQNKTLGWTTPNQLENLPVMDYSHLFNNLRCSTPMSAPVSRRNSVDSFHQPDTNFLFEHSQNTLEQPRAMLPQRRHSVLSHASPSFGENPLNLLAQNA